MTRKLTPKQKKFADDYIKTGNATKSAISAGYSNKYAHTNATKLLQNTTIKSYINACMQEIESAKIMDAKEAMELLSRIARGEETETVFVPLIDGTVSEEQKEADLKTKIIAAKEIIKRYPNDDQLLQARLRNEIAKARIAEYQANELEGKSDKNPLLFALAEGATKLIPKEDDNDEDTTE